MGSVTERDDLLIDFHDVSLRRGGNTLVGPVSWQVEPGQRWVIIGPNGAGKTSLIRIASAEEFPSEGTAALLGETLGKTDLRDLRAAIGMSSSALAHRIPDHENVGDLVISLVTPFWGGGVKNTMRPTLTVLTIFWSSLVRCICVTESGALFLRVSANA